MTITLSIVNRKGGVGKSTVAIMLADYFASILGKKVLLIDTDPQGNSSAAFGFGPLTFDVGVNEVFLRQIHLLRNMPVRLESTSDAISQSRGVDIIPADFRLERIDYWGYYNATNFSTTYEILQTFTEAFPWLLKRALMEIGDEYDIIIIDTPPAFKFLSENAALASDYALVPVELGPFELDGFGRLIAAISDLQARYGSGAELLGVVITRYDGRTILESDYEFELREHPRFGNQIFKTVLSRTIHIREAIGEQESIFSYKRLRREKRLECESFGKEVYSWLKRAHTKRETATSQET